MDINLTNTEENKLTNKDDVLNIEEDLNQLETSKLMLKSLPVVHIPDHDDQDLWKVKIDDFTSKRVGSDVYNAMPKGVRSFYKNQDRLITAYEDMQLNALTSAAELANIENVNKESDMAAILSKITFFINILLLVMKVVAAILSGSLSVISTVIDSAVDLISGALIWWSTLAVKKRDIYKYPQGYTRIEPVTIIILAVIMSVASLLMIRESIEQIVNIYLSTVDIRPIFTITTIAICLTTVVLKIGLFVICRRYKSPSLQALAQDSLNDVLSNSFAILFGYIGYRYWSYGDPLGAVVICLYIIVSWFSTAGEQIKMLTGLTATPDMLKKITWAALNHHKKIKLIDTVRAFHFGSNFLVEVDIVLPEDMTVRESHDIGESLQRKIERMPECERCFVHIDFEIEHCPTREHKIV